MLILGKLWIIYTYIAINICIIYTHIYTYTYTDTYILLNIMGAYYRGMWMHMFDSERFPAGFTDAFLQLSHFSPSRQSSRGLIRKHQHVQHQLTG